MNVASQICLAALLLCGILTAQAAGGPSSRYLLRLEHSTFQGHACALVQTTGTFHLEVNHGDDVKVFEGAIPPNDLREIEAALNSTALVDLSQPQIEEPLIRTRHDELQVTVLRNDGWQDLYFRSSDSQQPFERWLQPLVHWLDDLHKLPHRQLSEDEGKNNCLPPKPITLKKRDADAQPEPVTSKTTAHILSAGPTPTQPPSEPVPQLKPQSVPALLRMYSFEMQTGSAHESCILIGENGMYRFEDRTQRTGKPVNAKIRAGEISADKLQGLRRLLDDPALAKIEHHEPHSRVVPIMGDLLEISISRPVGIQHFTLSSAYDRPGFPSFYNGDANSRTARPLMKFLSENVENNTAGVLDPNQRNGCTEAP